MQDTFVDFLNTRGSFHAQYPEHGLAVSLCVSQLFGFALTYFLPVIHVHITLQKESLAIGLLCFFCGFGMFYLSSEAKSLWISEIGLLSSGYRPEGFLPALPGSPPQGGLRTRARPWRPAGDGSKAERANRKVT